MGALRDAVAAALADGALTDEQRRRLIRRIRAQGLRDNLPALPVTFTAGAFTITIESAQMRDDDLELVLSASRLGVPIPLDNPYVFVNPPTMINDPAGDVVIPYTDRDGVEHTRTLREAPLLALRAIVADAVRDAWQATQ